MCLSFSSLAVVGCNRMDVLRSAAYIASCIPQNISILSSKDPANVIDISIITNKQGSMFEVYSKLKSVQC